MKQWSSGFVGIDTVLMPEDLAGQKVNEKIDAYGHDVDDSDTDLCPWPRDDAESRLDVSTPFSIVIELEAT